MRINHSLLKVRLYTFILLFALCNYIFSQSIDLKSTDNQADYLVISSENFFDTIKTLTTFRESQGLNTMTISINDIYEQFQDTLSRQDAVKHFVSYTLEYWSDPKPQYLLLAGDVEFVPSYKVQSYFHASPELKEDSVSIDDQFAVNIYEDDNKPDIAIGRMPASNNQQLKNIIAKTIKYEKQLLRENYSIDFLGLADYRENESYFENQIEVIINDILPDYYYSQRIDRRTDSPFYGASDDIIENINDGTVFVNYYGHGSPFVWADSSFFYFDNIADLNSNDFPFVLTTMGCSQRFDVKDSLSIVEELLFRENSGTVMSFAPAGLTFAKHGNEVIQAFYKSMFMFPDQSVGKIIESIKNDLPIDHKPDDFYLRHTLLGDPALVFPEDIVSKLPGPGPEIPGDFTLFQNYPNPFNSETIVKFYLNTAGNVNIEAYDITGRKVDVIFNDILNTGTHTVKWNPGEIASGIYLLHMQFHSKVKTIRTLYIK